MLKRKNSKNGNKMRHANIGSRVVAALLPAIVLLLLPHALALDDDEFSGLAAETLTVTVGYFGGPYYEKRVFTLDELWAMDVQYVDYTFIDNMPSVVIDHVAGVALTDLMDAAGIDVGSVETFNFWTNDKRGGYYNSMRKVDIIDAPRFCFYSLPDNFDYDWGVGNEFAASEFERVPTMIALADDWNRSLAGAEFGSDYQSLNTNTRFRLVFGQTNAAEHTASASAKWIHKIEVTLGGAPTGTSGESVLDGTVGSEFRSLDNGQLIIDTDSSAVAQGGAGAGATLVGREFSILPKPVAQSDGDDGGVQNWRRDEMSEDASELGEIDREMPVTPTIAAFAAFIIVGGIWEYARYKRA